MEAEDTIQEQKQTGRICEIDYLKGILILLMVSFHLVYIEELYPYAKQVVYTFHMPCFLLISGYLMNIRKGWAGFLRTMSRLLVPYVVMESAYTLMASLLPINEHIEVLTATVWLDKLLLHPIGPYWYLRTMTICGFLYYVVFRHGGGSSFSRSVMLGIIYYVLATYAGIVSFVHSLFFLAGVMLRQGGVSFTAAFQPVFYSVIAFMLLAAGRHNLESYSIGSLLVVFFSFSIGIFTYHIAPSRLRRLLMAIGRDSLHVFLFSPLFTFVCKFLVPVFRFDPSGLLFLVASLSVCVSGSLLVGRVVDGVPLQHVGRKTE